MPAVVKAVLVTGAVVLAFVAVDKYFGLTDKALSKLPAKK